jgi:hypothetical protein
MASWGTERDSGWQVRNAYREPRHEPGGRMGCSATVSLSSRRPTVENMRRRKWALMSEEEIPGRIIPAGTKVFTEDEVIQAVFAFDGGCNPGRVAWLKTLGINVDMYGKKVPTTGTSELVVTAKVTVNWSEWRTWFRQNYDDYSNRRMNSSAREWSMLHQLFRNVLFSDYNNISAIKGIQRTYEVIADDVTG